MLRAIEEECPFAIFHTCMNGLICLEFHGSLIKRPCSKCHLCHIEGGVFPLSQYLSVEIHQCSHVHPLAGIYILCVHARIAIVALHIGVGQSRSFCPHLHVPNGRHVSVLLCVSDTDAYILRLCRPLVYHGRTLQRVVCSVGIHRPVLSIERCFNLVLIEEGGIFKLRPHLVEFRWFAKVYLQPLILSFTLPIAVTRFPQGGIIIIYSIFWLEPIIVIGRCGHFCSECEVLVF